MPLFSCSSFLYLISIFFSLHFKFLCAFIVILTLYTANKSLNTLLSQVPYHRLPYEKNPPPKFFDTHNPGDLRAHTMSCPGNTPSLPQQVFPNSLRLPSPQEMPRVYFSALRLSQRKRGIIHSRRDKHPTTIGELPKLIHLFHPLGLHAVIQGRCEMCCVISYHLRYDTYR